MTHQEIHDGNVIDRYVMGKLSPDLRQSFQEHYFECDECFDQTQLVSRFSAGIRDAAHNGTLVNSDTRSFENPFFAWFKPVMALSVATSVVLAVVLAWLWLVKIPALRRELAEEHSARLNSERAGMEQLAQQRQQFERERDILTKQSGQSQQKADDQKPPIDEIARLDSDRVPDPVVILESSRSSGGPTEVSVSSKANSFILWLPVEPLGRFSGFQVQLFSQSTQVHSVKNVKPNREGALAVKVPTQGVLSGNYVVKLYGTSGRSSELLGEYSLRITRNQ
jgi:hypothetical protein